MPDKAFERVPRADDGAGALSSAPKLFERAAVVEELRAMRKIALPVIVAYVFEMGLGFIALIFLGHAKGDGGDDDDVNLNMAGAGLAMMYANITGMSVGVGLCTGIDTLASQAFGARQYHAVGLIAQRAVWILLLAAIPVSVLWISAESILLAIGQTDDVSRIAGHFLLILVPGLIPRYLFEVLRRYLQAQAVTAPVLYSTSVSAAIFTLLVYVLTVELRMGYRGVAVALAVAYYSMLLVLLFFVLRLGLHRQTWGGWSRESFRAWKPYLSLALPGLVMLSMEWVAFEVMTLLSGLLPDPEVSLAAQNAIMSVLTMLFMIPLGVSTSASARVGQFLGDGEFVSAKRAAYVCLLFISVVMSAIGVLLLACRSQVGLIYTSDPDVVGVITNALAFVCLAEVTDGFQGVASGVVRGCGRQKLGAIINVVGYWLLMVPLGVAFAFEAGMGVPGLALGIALGLLAVSLSYGVVILRTDWENQARLAADRVDADATGKEMPMALLGRGDDVDTDEAQEEEGGEFQVELDA